MNSSIVSALNKIDFVNRYFNLCNQHNNFADSLVGNKKELYELVLNKFEYKVKYISKDKIFDITETNSSNSIEYNLRLILKDGLVECSFFFKINEEYQNPCGRMDFICEKINSSYKRTGNTLPMFSNEHDLEIILRGLFSIYEDIKSELIHS